jgi:hypothetical protein
MNQKLVLVSSAFAVLVNLATTAFGGADDYTFKPVKPEVKASNVAIIAVHLVHKPTGRPVADARIMETRLVMPHHGSTEMTSAIAPLPRPEPGVFAFKAPLMMEGNWLLSISAKVPGEAETVVGTINFRVIR